MTVRTRSILIIAALSCSLFAQNPPGKRTYTTQKIESSAPHIDGKLDDPCWQQGQWAGDFVQFMPNEGAPGSQKTWMKMLYDDKNLYVAFRAYDSEPGKIDRRPGRRDEQRGDVIGFCVDSYFDHLTGFEFDLTASGAKVDLVLMNNFRWDTNWDAVWDGRVASIDSGWTAEFRIPFSQLRYQQKEEQIWGLHAWRWINRNEEEDQFSLIPRNGPGHIHDMGFLRGLQNLPKSRQIEFLLYTVGQLNVNQGNDASTSLHQRRWLGNAGLDGKIGLSSNFTVDYTINPDFGQVEADPSVLNLSVFEVFYDEKRPFFLEGRTLFDFGVGDEMLFYSRRIGHPPSYHPELGPGVKVDMPSNTSILGAVKLTGKSRSGLSLGLIENVTQKETAELVSPQGCSRVTVEPPANYLVARIKQEMNNSNTIAGAIFTMTDRQIGQSALTFIPDAAYSGGFDFAQYFDQKKYDLGVKWFGSLVHGSESAMLRLQTAPARYYQRPDAGHLSLDSSLTFLSGQGGEIHLGKSSYGHWRYSADLSWKSPGLEFNDLGYLRSSDEIEGETELTYIVNEPSGIFHTYAFQGSVARHWDYDRKGLYTEVSLAADMSFRNRWRTSLGLYRSGEIRDTRLLRGGPSLYLPGYWGGYGSFSTDAARPLVLQTSLHHHVYDDEQSALSEGIANLSYKFNEALQFSTSLDLIREKVMLQYISTEEVAGAPRYLLGLLDRQTANVIFRIDCALSPNLTLQYYGSPYGSLGSYSRIRVVSDPAAHQPDKSTRLYTEKELLRDPVSKTIAIDEDGDGRMDYSLADPDFNFREFRSNLVLRWEVRPGSALYLVWSHARSSYENVRSVDWSDNIGKLWNTGGGHIFLAKFSYWFAM